MAPLFPRVSSLQSRCAQKSIPPFLPFPPKKRASQSKTSTTFPSPRSQRLPRSCPSYFASRYRPSSLSQASFCLSTFNPRSYRRMRGIDCTSLYTLPETSSFILARIHCILPCSLLLHLLPLQPKLHPVLGHDTYCRHHRRQNRRACRIPLWPFVSQVSLYSTLVIVNIALGYYRVFKPWPFSFAHVFFARHVFR